MSGSSSPPSTQPADPFVKVDISPPPAGSVTMLFAGIHAQEELGRPFLYKVELISGTFVDTTQLVGASVTLTCKRTTDDSDPTYFNGVAVNVVSSGIVGGAWHYHLELRPWIWLLTRVTDCLIFQKKSPFKIITDIFDTAGFSDYEDKRQASSGDTELDYCVQYRESSFDFVMRLMEKYGIYYFFKHESGKHTLCLADDPNSHDALSDSIPFVDDMTGAQDVKDHVWEWRTIRSLESAKVTYQDYNFTTPSTDLTSKSIGQPPHDQYKTFEVYEYPGTYDDTDGGTKLTDIRLQAIGWKRAVFDGQSNARGLHPGWQYTLSNHPDDAMNRAYLVISTEFSIQMGEGATTVRANSNDTYRTKVHAIPNDVHYRLDRKTPRPMIRGPQTAVVAGTSGEEIDPDEYGRVKVRFYWDRSENASGDTPSCWIRVAQTAAGAGFGGMFIPRIGQEVVVEFLEGNPDRPLIIGSVYNANVKIPYTMPDNKTRTAIKTNSSPGGSGFNELRFEDKANEEEVFFQAQKDYNKKVLNNETVTIHVDTTTTVETGNRSVTVSQGNDSTTVSQGNHKLDVSAGTSEVTAAQSITLTVGSNSIKIDTTSITITVGSNSVKMDATSLATTVGANSQQMGPSGMTTSSPTISMTGDSSVSITGATISLNG